MIGAHLDQQGTLIAPWGKLCEVCGGTGSLFKPFDKKFINYIKCPGRPTEGIYCRDGLGLTLYQDPSTPYFEEMGTGYRVAWYKAGFTRADFIKVKEHWKNTPKFILPEISTPKFIIPERPATEVVQLECERTEMGKLYWKVIGAIEWPFKVIGRRYYRWFGHRGSVRLWTEKLIGTDVRYKTNITTYSADRIVTNKWISKTRKWWEKSFQYGTHHINGDKWWSIQAQTKTNMVEVTWRQNVGWCMTHRVIGRNKGFTVRYHPLIWRIKSGVESHWPAPVFEVIH